MTVYGYIDEAGTKFDQSVMTVCLVVLEGVHSHTKIHREVMKGIYPNYEARVKSAKGAETKRPGIKYTEMDKRSRLDAANIFSAKTVSVITSIHYHEGCSTTYDEFYLRYRNMIKAVVADAIERYDDLDLTIATISGPNWDYQTSLSEEIEVIRAILHCRLGFRKVTLRFAAATVAGIQIADYYAGARREALLPVDEDKKSRAYDKIQKQYISESIEASEVALGRKASRSSPF